jgi:hypothetical protein
LIETPSFVVEPKARALTELIPDTYPKRIARYKERYRYHPPSSYKNNSERDSTCGIHPTYEKYFSNDAKTRSANDEDKTLYNLFFNNDMAHRGTIVELGAYNGIQESNSRFYDLCLGWDSLLIEGMSKTFDLLIQNRPEAHRLNFAPTCNEIEEAQNKTIKFDNYPQTNAGLADGSVTTSFSFKNWTVEVPCRTLTNVLLDIFPQGHVTLFSLDVEGSEPLVLKQLDFERVYIEVMIIENRNNFCNQSNCKSRDEFRKIMDKAGYKRFVGAVKKSDLYIHPNSEYLAKMG